MRRLAVLLLLAAACGPSTADVSPDAQDAPGSELLGTVPPGGLQGLRWPRGPALDLESLRGKVVLVRWWTDTCPFCRATAPALNRLQEDFGADGLVVIGVFHPKPPTRVSTNRLESAVERLGIAFPVAVDDDWSVLRRWWLDTGDRSATSFSFLLDREGKIRFVHPGPVFSLEGNPSAVADYRRVRAHIETLIDGNP